LQEFQGEPEYVAEHIISRTICHNHPTADCSRKLYYYPNSGSGLFKCYTGGCEEPIFDIFELIIKVFHIQRNQDLDLNDAVRWVAQRFNIAGRNEDNPEEEQLEDWEKFEDYKRIQNIEMNSNHIILKEYDDIILDRFVYDVQIMPWLKENITQEVMDMHRIGYYPGGEQITIPHYDVDGRFIGLRGRALIKEDAERYGKYRPLKVCKTLYNHPLGMNLYNLNFTKDNIKRMGSALIVEGEKSCLKFASYFGAENDISVACCGSSISAYQIQLLIEAGAKEIIVALDRQFQAIGDAEYKHLVANLTKIHQKYNSLVKISFIFDKRMITNYKDSPLDKDAQTFLTLYKERVII